MESLPKGVHRVQKRGKDGSIKTYWYYRPTGKSLPDPSSPEFLSRIEQAKRFQSQPDTERQTFGTLVRLYQRSPGYRQLARSTQQKYDASISELSALNDTLVTDIKRADIITIRDAMAINLPGAANNLLLIMSVLMNFAIILEWRESNPCTLIGKLKGSHHKRWTEDNISYALSHFEEQYRRAVLLALYTGQREGDCTAMRWEDFDGTGIKVKQQKTGAELWIPCHRKLQAELQVWCAEAETSFILTTAVGRPWRGRTFSSMFCDMMKDHPALDGLVFHGLRKAAAARLAEAGCSTKEIMSITGHESLSMIELYTKEVEQRQNALAAMRKLEGGN